MSGGTCVSSTPSGCGSWSRLEEFVMLQKTKAEGENSWNISAESIDKETYDLSANNPNAKSAYEVRTVELIMEELNELEKAEISAITAIKGLL